MTIQLIILLLGWMDAVGLALFVFKTMFRESVETHLSFQAGAGAWFWTGPAAEPASPATNLRYSADAEPSFCLRQ